MNMKNSIIKLFTIILIATMMMSTVATAAEGVVNVYEEVPDIGGLYDGKDTAGWLALDLSTKVTNTTSPAALVLNFDSHVTGIHNTPKQARVITGFIIPKVTDDGDIEVFNFWHDDGIKVFIEKQVGTDSVQKDNWILTGNGKLEFTDFTLEVNKVYPFRIEYFDWGGDEKLLTDIPMNWFHDVIPEYTVTYVDEDLVIDTEAVKHGLNANGIDAPTKTGFVFDEWTLEGDVYGFDTPVLGDLTLSATWVDDVNLWVAADDKAEVYFDGIKVKNIDHGGAWKDPAEYYVPVKSEPFIAAKAWDTSGEANIAGFRLVFKNNDAKFINTDSSWWVYYDTKTKAAPADVTIGENTYDWNDIEYRSDGWVEVTPITNPENTWAEDGEFPDGSVSSWVWSINYDVPASDAIDSPVYLRSQDPRIQYTVDVAVEGSGAASIVEGPSEATSEDGSSVTGPIGTELSFFEKAATGWQFDGWNVELPSSISGTVTYTATFSQIPTSNPPTTTKTVKYNLAVEIEGKGTVTGGGSYKSGKTATLVATAGDGYVFDQWIGAKEDGTVYMNKNKKVTAKFIEVPAEEELGEEVETVVPEAPIVEEVILDIVTPAGTPDDIEDQPLPQTGGLPLAMYTGFGLALSGFGYKLRKRK